ncbi:MAG: DUF2344 domain-containing protein, partial [Lachnospiraceae bacterium]|nr:DUF2344 domain-containing protein [Lachnospiraceae bacterium]
YQQSHIPVVKKTKKGQREIDLKESIYQLEVRGDKVYMLVDAGSGSNIKPEFVMEPFFERTGTVLPEYPFRIHRVETYKRAENGRLVPLIV